MIPQTAQHTANTIQAPIGSTITITGETVPIIVASPAPHYDPAIDPIPTVSIISHEVPANPPLYHTGPSNAGTSLLSVSRSVRHPLAVVSTWDNGGQAGVTIQGGSTAGNGNVYAAMTAYNNVSLNAPPDSTHGNYLYAPTTHGPSGNCFELGADYWRYFGNTSTSAYVRLYNFCDNGGTFEDAYDKIIDSNFLNAYVRVFSNGNGYPEFTSEQIAEADGKWHALIYNYSTSTWEDWGYSYAGSTSFNSGEGWSIFETHYASGGCSSTPVMSTDGFQVQTSSGWQYVDSSIGKNYLLNLDCFDNPTPTYYVPVTTAGEYQWTVTNDTSCSTINSTCSFSVSWPSGDPSCDPEGGYSGGYTGNGDFVASPSTAGTLTQNDTAGTAQFTRSVLGSVTVTARAQYETYSIVSGRCVPRFTYSAFQTWQIERLCQM